MLDKLKRLLKPAKAVHQPFFRYEKTVEQLPGYVDIFGNAVPDADQQFYPPKLHGISVFSVESIAKRYSEAFDKLADDVKIGSHRTDDKGTSLFEARYLTVIMRFIEYVHMLPASENQHHSQAGGMLRHSLETAHMAMMEADEHRPPTTRFIDDDELRRPRYIYAAWVAGLLHDTGKLFSDIQVTALSIYDDKNRTEAPAKTVYKDAPVWQPHVESLIEWAKRNQVVRYSVEYKKSRKYKEHDKNSAILLPKLLKGEGLNYILQSPDDLYAALNDTLSGYMGSNDYLPRMVRNADAYSTGKDVLKISESAFGERAKSLVMLISEQMRTARADWTFNRPNGHAWILGGEVFLRWSNAFNTITEVANDNLVERLPRKARKLLSMMEDNRIVEPFTKDNRSIMFAAGEYTPNDVERVISGQISVHWEELIKLTWSGHAFGGDPLPSNGSGLIMLAKDDNKHEFLHAYPDGSIVPLEIKESEQEQSRGDESPDTKTSSEPELSVTRNETETKVTAQETDSKSDADSDKPAKSEAENKRDSKRQQQSNSKPRKKKSKAGQGLTFVNASKSDDENNTQNSETENESDQGVDNELTSESASDTQESSPSKNDSESQSDTQSDRTTSSQTDIESDADMESDSSGIEADNSLPDVVSAIRESSAYISTDSTGVHTIDAKRLGEHLDLSPEQVAELAHHKGLLKRDYSSNTLEQYRLIDNKQQVVLQLKRKAASKGDLIGSPRSESNTSKDNVSPNKRTIKSPKKAKEKERSHSELSTTSSVETATEEPLSSDNGFRLFAHRSKTGTLGHLLNELVVDNEMTSLITEGEGSIRFIAKRVEDGIKAKKLPGYQQVTSSDIFDACFEVIGDELDAEFRSGEGTFITVPLTYLEQVRFNNVIK